MQHRLVRSASALAQSVLGLGMGPRGSGGCLCLSVFLLLVAAASAQTNATMTDLGSAAPPLGPYDIAQTLCTYCSSASGTYDGPDGLNYYTDNGPTHGSWAGQTFTTATNATAYNLASVSIRTGGVNHSSDYATAQLYHLYLYSLAGATATLLAHFTNSSSFVDGDWVQWSLGTNTITLSPGSTYAYGFGRDTNGTGWAGLGNSSGNLYSGGELAMLPSSGGTITFGSSHSYDATFELGLNAVGAPAVVVTASPSYGLTGQTFTVTATVTQGMGTVTNVTANLSSIGGPSAAGLVFSNANVYTNSFTIPATAPSGSAYLIVTATDTTPLSGASTVVFTVLSHQAATIDSTKAFQTIEGLGGAVAFYGGSLTSHPYKQEIYTNAFAGLNLSMLRLGNWYRYQTPIAGFDGVASEVVAQANRVLGHPVQVYISSWAPPAFLKNNGQTGNGGSLLYTNGGFVYPGFAQYWYDSIQAYRSNGVSPTWISIQNEPDFSATYDSCLLYASEQGTNVASYSKALDATFQRITNLPSPPKILAPECVHIAYNDLQNYAATMNGNSFYGICHHLYGDGFDSGSLSVVTNIFPSKPRFMTEFGLSDMIDQASLIHNVLVFEQASGYNYWSLVWPGTSGGLIQLEQNTSNPSTWTNAPPGIPEPHGYWLAPAYWSMKHFSCFVNPGFKRVSAAVTDNNVLSSAYLSPDGFRLVLVLINTSATLPSSMSVNYGTFAASTTSVYQTVGINAWQSLGPLASSLSLPPRSLTTIVLDRIVTVGSPSNPFPTNGASNLSLNSSLSWTPGSNAVTHAVYWGTSSNAVAAATPSSPQFQGIAYTNNFSLSAASWGTPYFWRIDEIAYVNTNQGSPVWSFSTAPAVQLPVPWQSQDIGGALGQSSAIYNNGVFAVTGGGADIQNTADTFRFAYVTITGDCTITARITSEQNINVWSKAGVMIRQSLNANAANAFIGATPGNGVTWQYRSTTGGSTSWNNTGGLNAPYWLRLVRSGSVFTGFYSLDGVNWTQQGTATFAMTSTIYVGLAVTSHDTTTVCTATFDNVTVPGWSVSSPPATPSGLTATAGNAQVGLTWVGSTNASSYNVKRSTTNAGPYSLIANVTSTNYTDSGLVNGTAYYYVVSALNAAGESINSVQVGATPQVFAPTGLSTTAVSTSQINLLWNALANASSYNVKRSDTNGGPYSTIASALTATNYQDTGLAGGTVYYYVVSAIVSGSETPDSPQATATTFSPTLGSLVHRYSFTETNGTTVADSVGGPVWNGTLPNGGTFSGGQLTLSSSFQQYVSLPAGVVTSLSNITALAWVDLASISYWSRVFDFGSGATTYMFLTPQNGFNSTARFGITSSGAASEQDINCNVAVSPGAWHQVAVTLNSGTGVLYVDGAPVGTNTAMTVTPASLGTTLNNYLGKSQSSSDPYLNGSFDEFRIYDVALSASEIAATAALGPDQLLSTNSPPMSIAMTETNLVISWPVSFAGFGLQSSTDLTSGAWANVLSPAPQIVADQWQVALPLPADVTSAFYRLSK